MSTIISFSFSAYSPSSILRWNSGLTKRTSRARYHKLWDGYQKERREKPTPRPKHPESPTSSFKELGRKRFKHEAYGNVVFCRVPEALLRDPYSITAKPTRDTSPLSAGGAQQPLASSNGDVMAKEDDYDYDNPHTNCSQLLSSPSTLHILSSDSYPSATKPPETFISSFDRVFATHMKLVHFSGNLFNMSVVWANDEVRRELGLSQQDTGRDQKADSGAILINLDETFPLEWVHAKEGVDGDEASEEGLAITGGFWGMEGPDASEPKGEGREGAEVWFGVVEG